MEQRAAKAAKSEKMYAMAAIYIRVCVVQNACCYVCVCVCVL